MFVILLNLHYHWSDIRMIAFYLSIGMTAVTLFGMAVWKSYVTGSSYISSVVMTLVRIRSSHAPT